jgi:hydroxymethylbilane synthase
MLPAPAQGALAIECRAGDEELARFLAASLDDAATRAAVTAERSVLATLEAGCSAPIGALADVVSDYMEDAAGNDVIVDRLSLRAIIGTTTGALLRASGTADMDNAEKLGASLALELLDMGADDLPNVQASRAERIAGSGVQE